MLMEVPPTGVHPSDLDVVIYPVDRFSHLPTVPRVLNLHVRTERQVLVT
jgi:hypothetical protein